MICFLAAAPLVAAEPDEPMSVCPLPVADGAVASGDKPAVRRLRSTMSAGDHGGRADDDLAEMAFVTSSSPNPEIRNVLQVPGGGRTHLEITVVNNSRHASPDGGITLSFPDFNRPSDRARFENIAVPEGMALHVIPAGGELFGRNGVARAARHLMIEVHGSWGPRQARTLELDVLDTPVPVVVHYRSALSDSGGDYHNTPADSHALDQQGWPAFACLIGSGSSSLAQSRNASDQGVETRGRQ